MSKQPPAKSELGLLQIYTGDGKGKTSAALGLAFRASGHDLRVLMIQFMKDTGYYGEEISSKLLPHLTWRLFGRHDFVDLKNPAQVDLDLAAQGWAFAKEAILSGNYDLIILDEANVALACGLIPLDEALQTLTNRSPYTEIVVTGRYAPQALLDMADLITEMKEIRHPFTEKQIEARQGIEY